MKQFLWKGIDLSGKNLSGKIFANSSEELSDLLLNKGIALISYSEKNERRNFFTLFKKRISLKEKFLFFERLYLLLDSGIELLPALNIISKQSNNKKMNNITSLIILYIKSGNGLSDSMKNLNLFDSYILNLIAAGEESGKLSLVLQDISKDLEFKIDTLKKIQQVSIMPLITLIVAFFIVLGIFIFVIPQFESLFLSFDKKLPNITQFIFNISHFIRSDSFYYYVIFFLIMLICFRFSLYLHFIKRLKDRVLLRFFLIKNIISNYDFIFFLKTLSIFLSSGLDMQSALKYSIPTVKNSYLRFKFKLIQERVLSGDDLSNAIENHLINYIDESVISLIVVGQSTGDLVSALNKAEFICTKNLKSRIKFFTIFLQPLLLFIVGLIIALLMLAVYLPIFGMAEIL